MRALKVLLFAALVAGWWQMWQHHDEVAAAYTEDREPLALELKGVGAVPEPTERSVSPFALLPPGPERSPTFSSMLGVTEPTEETATDPELTGGDVTLDGVVQLADGTPVSGATIRIERFTVDGQAVGETVSGPDGTWRADGLMAGRLRVRAYAPNALASVESIVVVLSRTGQATIPLQVEPAARSIQFEITGPLGIATGGDATVAVVASRELVDDDGRLVRIPLAGQPLLATFDPPARLLSADLVTTDDGGAARYLLACDREGTFAGRVVLADEQGAVDGPPCLSAEALAELEAAAAAEAEAGAEADESGSVDEDTEVDR